MAVYSLSTSGWASAIGIGIKQVASSSQEISLPFSDLWLICGSVSGCLFVQAILHLVAVEDSDVEPKTRKKWATYRIISAIVVISLAILGLLLTSSGSDGYFGIYMCTSDSS